jgi:hypothetical protein
MSKYHTVESGSVIQGHGTAEPDPKEILTDLQHRSKHVQYADMMCPRTWYFDGGSLRCVLGMGLNEGFLERCDIGLSPVIHQIGVGLVSLAVVHGQRTAPHPVSVALRPVVLPNKTKIY